MFVIEIRKGSRSSSSSKDGRRDQYLIAFSLSLSTPLLTYLQKQNFFTSRI